MPSTLSRPAGPALAFARLAEIEARMTVNRDDSEGMRINAAAGVRPVVVTSDVLEVIRQGLLYSSDGDGAYASRPASFRR